MLWCKSNAAPGYSGTGVIVKSEKQDDEYYNVVFSAAHCFKVSNTNQQYLAYSVKIPIYKNWSELERWEEHNVSIKRINAKTDACVLHFKSKKKLLAATPNFRPKLYLGNEVFHVGTAGAYQQPRIDFGRITSINIPAYGNDVLRTSVYTIPGDSGSPVYHEYQVVGITHAVEPSPSKSEYYREFTYVIPLNPYFSSGDLVLKKPETKKSGN
jgi:hypothetical protein